MHHVLVLEPFGGGSHRSLYEGWQRFSRHQFTVVELPAVHWKWRSRHSSLTLARKAQTLVDEGQRFDAVFCSNMLNLPEWKGFAGATLGSLPSIVYFHENQFTYPLSPGEQRDYNYAYNNLLTWLAADSAWFNSAFHFGEFSDAAATWLRRMPDFRHLEELENARERSQVLPPGIVPPPTPPVAKPTIASATNERRSQVVPSNSSRVVTIGWVSRWEHDKRPDVFCRIVTELLREDAAVELVLLGQQFSRRPPELQELVHTHGDRIRHVGHADSRAKYWSLLGEMDLVVSTAEHEFFGVGVLEAVWAGAIPLVPRGLAYPEVFELESRPERECWFYGGELTKETLAEAVHRVRQLEAATPPSSTRSDLKKYCWSHLADAYDHALDAVVDSRR